MFPAISYAINDPAIYRVIPNPGTVAKLVQAFALVLEEVNWTVSGRAGGFRLLGVSPQGYSVYCDIWTDGTRVFIQEVSTQSAAVGYQYELQYTTSLASWQIVAHPCGFAISRPDTSYDPSGSAVIVGIPMASQACGISAALTITEIWFGFGDCWGNPFFAATNPRRNLDIGDGRFAGNQTACLNGTLFPLQPFGDTATANWSDPQIVRISSGAPDGVNAPDAPLAASHVAWYDGTDLLYPAMIAWGTGDNEPVRIEGQIYNAACRSLPAPRDQQRSWDDLNWISYTDEYWFGTLWLTTGVPPPGGPPIVNIFY